MATLSAFVSHTEAINHDNNVNTVIYVQDVTIKQAINHDSIIDTVPHVQKGQNKQAISHGSIVNTLLHVSEVTEQALAAGG